MAYATYDYYKNAFFGSMIPCEIFPRCINLAGKYIDQFTFERITDPENITGLEDCACEMAETIYQMRFKNESKEKKSENIDGYSVTYVTEMTDGQASEDVLCRKLYDICKLYLAGTGLMYCGVYAC